MKFEFEGLQELMAEIERTNRGMENARDEALKAGGEVMQKETEKAAPKKTGNLKANIKISDIEDGNIFVYVDNQGKAYYGHMHEFGTSKMPAKPFMAPSLNKSKMKINQAMAEKLRNRLRGT
ncbi:HK97-gp10 family putative phage morphogenesis protein [Niallia sp. FSL W8-1348]|uniref:HK97-gp10 family putative phage morphogenesis protein n=1 Tax=Niallia sp. FSL W8-1348 TaxID=2954656 RepID=UPI0030F8B0B9